MRAPAPERMPSPTSTCEPQAARASSLPHLGRHRCFTAIREPRLLPQHRSRPRGMAVSVLILLPFVSRRQDFVIVLLLVIDRFDHEQDYEQEHERSFGCGGRGVGQRACSRSENRRGACEHADLRPDTARFRMRMLNSRLFRVIRGRPTASLDKRAGGESERAVRIRRRGTATRAASQ